MRKYKHHYWVNVLIDSVVLYRGHETKWEAIKVLEFSETDKNKHMFETFNDGEKVKKWFVETLNKLRGICPTEIRAGIDPKMGNSKHYEYIETDAHFKAMGGIL